LSDLCGFLHATANAHPQPRDATRALAAAFAGLIGRDSAPTLEGVLSDAPYAILLTAILIEHHRSLFSATAALDAEADADARRFRAQMEASYKRLRANMSSAYKAERAELRQKHSEHEISALMQRRADKVRTGTLDSTSLEAVERLAAASRAASVAAAGDSQRSALSSTGAAPSSVLATPPPHVRPLAVSPPPLRAAVRRAGTTRTTTTTTMAILPTFSTAARPTARTQTRWPPTRPPHGRRRRQRHVRR
jgi:hypothetical protein